MEIGSRHTPSELEGGIAVAHLGDNEGRMVDMGDCKQGSSRLAPLPGDQQVPTRVGLQLQVVAPSDPSLYPAGDRTLLSGRRGQMGQLVQPPLCGATISHR